MFESLLSTFMSTAFGKMLDSVFRKRGSGGGNAQSAAAENPGIIFDANKPIDRLADSQKEIGMMTERLANMKDENVRLQVENAELRKANRKNYEEAEADLQRRSHEAEDPSRFKRALAELKEGRADAAEALFRDILEKKRKLGRSALREASIAANRIGAIAFYHDTEKALRAYEEAARLDPDNVAAWNQSGHLYRRSGNLEKAESAYRKVLALSDKSGDDELQSLALFGLGNVFLGRGDLVEAEEMYRKSLALNKKLGHKEGMAGDYGNLATVLSIRGNLVEAERMHHKSLALYEELGHKEGMANGYGNLGIMLSTRGDLAGAEKMYRKSLALCEVLGHKEGMASGYGNLGDVSSARGDLAGAEKMYRKSLTLYEELGHKGGMATNYVNLGNMSSTLGNLSTAEKMYRKALALSEELGHKEGMAINYANLGSISEAQGNLTETCRLWGLARKTFLEAGVAHNVEEIERHMQRVGCAL